MISPRKQFWSKRNAETFAAFVRENKLSTNHMKECGFSVKTINRLKTGPCIVSRKIVEKLSHASDIPFSNFAEPTLDEFVLDVVGRFADCDIDFVAERLSGKATLAIESLGRLIRYGKVRTERRFRNRKLVTFFYGV